MFEKLRPANDNEIPKLTSNEVLSDFRLVARIRENKKICDSIIELNNLLIGFSTANDSHIRTERENDLSQLLKEEKIDVTDVTDFSREFYRQEIKNGSSTQLAA